MLYLNVMIWYNCSYVYTGTEWLPLDLLAGQFVPWDNHNSVVRV